MEGYSKIKGTNTSSNNKSRSIDFSSDLQSSPQPHITNENLSPNHTTTFHQNTNLESKSNDHKPHDENESEDIIGNDEKAISDTNTPSVVKLSRACSVSSASRMGLERQGSKRATSSFQSVKRVFSMRRSSSVSERYCRIHDQGLPILDDVAEDNEMVENNKKKKSGSGRILKACKRLFGI